MKRLIIICVALCLCADLATAASSDLVKKGASLLKVLKKRRTGGETFASNYKGWTASQRKGFRVLFKAVEGSRGSGSWNDLASDLQRVRVVLKESNYNMDLPDFLDRVKQLDEIGADLGDQQAVKDTILGLLTKTSKAGNVGKPQMRSIKGAAAEIIEIVNLKNNGVTVEAIQPRINGLLFREAKCTGGQISGTWYLEVKNWPKFEKGKGKESLKTQITSHFSRASTEYTGPDVDSWPGLYYRFAAAGDDGVNFDAFKAAIEEQVETEAREILKEIPGLTSAQIDAKVEQFLSRVLIEKV